MGQASIKKQSLVSLGLLVGLVVMLLIGLALPLKARYDLYSQELERDTRRLQQFMAVAAVQSEIEGAAAAFEERGLSSWVYVGSPDNVRLEIQRRVTELLSRHGGELRTVSPIPTSEREGFRVVGVRVHFNGELESVISTLAALEQAQPFLLLEDIHITVGRSLRSGSEPATQTLDVQLSAVSMLAAVEEGTISQ